MNKHNFMHEKLEKVTGINLNYCKVKHILYFVDQLQQLIRTIQH